MDEATANIDYETESTIQLAIDKFFNNSTVITIAHRIKTIMNYDKVLVLEKGNVIEFDSPKNLLLKKESLFYSLVNTSINKKE